MNEDKLQSQLRLVSELSTKLQGLLESDNFYQEVINTIVRKFNYYCIHIWTVNGLTGAAHLEAQAGAYRNHLKLGHEIRRGEGITGSVIESRKTYLCPDVSKDPHFTNLSLPVRTRSQLSVPVLTSFDQGQVVAVLNIESDELNAFDAADVTTLEAIAAQIGVAITNQRLLQDAERHQI
jgi:GAF domain-containing protein